MFIPRKRVFWAVGLGHMLNDIFISMGPVILAFLSVSILPMTNTQIGLTVSATQLMGAVSQPGFGLLADRTGGRWLGAGGVAWTVGFMLLCLVGAQTGYFWLLFIPFVLASVGSGAFHPVGAMHAATSDRDHAASYTAYFFMMGQLGLGIGPALAGLLLEATNPNLQPLFTGVFAPVYDGSFRWWGEINVLFLPAVLAFPVVSFMALALPTAARHRDGQAHSAGATIRLKDLPLGGFAILIAVVSLRSLAQPGSVTFIPVLFQAKGWSPAEYGGVTSSFWIASGIAGIMFGNLADRIDRRRVIAASLILAAPAFFVLPLMDGVGAFVVAIAAGGLAGGSHSLIVVLAQDLIPGAKGFASGMILGLIFGMGALGSALIGTISDQIGLNSTFQIVAALIVVAGLLALALPVRQKS